MGKAGITAYRVGTIKEIPGVRTYVSVDGGMSDNIRPMLYDAAVRGDDRQPGRAPAGHHGHRGGQALRERRHPHPRRCHRQAARRATSWCMPATGAYCFAMASNYNGSPRPAVLLVNEGRARVIIERESYADLVAKHHPLRRLRPDERDGEAWTADQDRAHRSAWASAPSGRASTGSSRRSTTRSSRAPASICRWPRVLEIDSAQGAGRCARRARSPTDFAEILDDPSIDIVVEVIGGTDAGLRLRRRGHAQGQERGHRQQAAAGLPRPGAVHSGRATLERHLRFEASVAGAIPIIKVMRESMIAAGLHTVYGIVNGTTNYILTRMYNEEGDYPEILAEAQELGYAEADPTADVGGADAAAKMAILASIAFHSRVTLADVAYSGIQSITLDDVRYAKELRLRGQVDRRGAADRRQGERAGVPGAAAARLIRWPPSAAPTTPCSSRATPSARSC